VWLHTRYILCCLVFLCTFCSMYLEIHCLLYTEVHCVFKQASESRHNGSSAPSISNLVVYEERMRPGHWLRSVFCVCLSALTLCWLGDRKDISPIKTSTTYPKGSVPEQVERKKTGLPRFTWKRPVKWKWTGGRSALCLKRIVTASVCYNFDRRN